MEAVFEYIATREEFEACIANAHAFLQEFGFKQVANPLRRYFGWFLPTYHKALKGRQGLVDHCLKMIEY